jgi:2-hydroxychromene-2-carboxylate isomerase
MNLEFWFDFASTYSYVSVMRIGSLIAGSEVRVSWRPLLLGPLFHAFGWSTSPFLLQKEKGAYMWKDMERQCRKHGLPWHRPSEFPRHTVLAARVALIGLEEPWLLPFAQQVMLANFAHDQNIGSESTIHAILDRMALPADALIGAAQADSNKAELRRATQEAQQRGVFGAPTFFVGEEMFWGNDRLEDALEHARAAKP